MSQDSLPSLHKQIGGRFPDAALGGHAFVPFWEHGTLLALIHEALAYLEAEGLRGVHLLTDPHTAREILGFDGTAEDGHLLYLPDFDGRGTPPENARVISNALSNATGGRVFLVLSPSIAFAFFLSDSVHAEKSMRGAWTGKPDLVACAFQALAGKEAPEISLPDTGSAAQAQLNLRMIKSHVSSLATRHDAVTRDKDDLFSVLDVLKAISSKRRAHDILYVFVEQIARVVHSDRCSVVRVWGHSNQGLVMVSHEDASFSDRKIDLAKYPELREAMETGEKVLISDVAGHPLTSPIADVLATAGIHSLLVIPITLDDQNVGTLLLRAVRRDSTFLPREVSFFEIVTEAASNALERAQLFENIQIANERLERLAITDGLTGIYNHRHFRERLEEELQRARRYKLPLSCMIFDVDDFKQLNDKHGHLAGDMVLCEMAARVQGVVRRTDLLARYGGEEFVVSMPQTSLAGGVAQAERVRDSVSSKPFVVSEQHCRVTVSVGVSGLDQERMFTCEDLIREADQALYHAKRSGKDRVMHPEDTLE